MVKRIVTIGLLLFLLSAGIAAFVATSIINKPIGADTTTHELVVKPGASLYKIAQELKQHGILKYPRVFGLYGRFKDQAGAIMQGEYHLHAGMTMPQILGMLSRGEVITYSVTIPEGHNMYQIADLLTRDQLVDPQRFLSLCKDSEFVQQLGVESVSLEGYLFPETYVLNRTMNEAAILKKMLSVFRANFSDDMRYRAHELSWSIDNVVTMASIIEKETGAAFERRLVSSVFHNRLKKNMRLQTDPTVVYGFLPDFAGRIRTVHLRTPHAYNTYIHSGLPPGPIASPGLAAIKAALWPEQSNYLYFVSKNNGTHAFSENYEQHNKYVYQYQILGTGS